MTLLCDPKPSEKCTKLTTFLASVDTLWNPEKGLYSSDFTAGLVRAQWRQQCRLGAKGTEEESFPYKPTLE